eukprot:jgi/Hompol1/1918/HPOL_002797-RA
MASGKCCSAVLSLGEIKQDGICSSAKCTCKCHRRTLSLCGSLIALVLACALGATIFHFAAWTRASHAALTTPPQAPIASNWTDIRLPPWISPSHYSLDLTAKLSDSTFGGKVTIDLNISQHTSFIVVHQHDLTIGAIRISDGTGTNIAIRSVESRPIEQYIVIFVQQPLAPGAFQISLEFSGVLTDSLEGFYRSKYTDSAGNIRYLASTQFAPISARNAFPCLDEPALKSVFDIAISAEPAFNVISNMPATSIVALDNGLRKFSFAPTVRMSTYLVAYVVSDFDHIDSSTKNGVKVRVFAQPGSAHMGSYALDAAVKVLETYEAIFGIPFPLPKCDLVAVPDFSLGAMENWGLVTFRAAALLLDPAQQSASQTQRVASIVAHELAHQWFGNLVTMKWWNDLWLNEGFASFVQYTGTDNIDSNIRLTSQFNSDSLAVAFEADQSILTHRIAVAVNDPAEINSIFDGISYQKGASVLRMLQAWLDTRMGKGYFFACLSKYLAAHAYSNTETRQLWESLQDPKIGDLPAFMSTWTDQPGFPVVSLSSPQTDFSSNHAAHTYFVASQTRFMFAGLVDPLLGINRSQIPDNLKVPDTTTQTWAVPLTFTLLSNGTGKIKQVGDRTVYELTERGPAQIELGKQLPPDTVVFGNAGQTGVFHVQHDNHTLAYLLEWLEADLNVLSNIDRAGLYSDIAALTLSGYIKDMTILGRVADLLKHEDDPIVWLTMLPSINNVLDAFAGHPARSQVESYMQKCLDKIVMSIGWKETTKSKGNHHIRGIIRSAIITKAVRIGHKKTIDTALELFKQLRNGKPANQLDVSADVLAAIYIAGVQYGSDLDFEWILQQYLRSTFAPDQQTFLDALASAATVAAQQRTLKLTLTGEIRRQDIISLVQRVAVNTPQGSTTAWAFLMDNWAEFTKNPAYGGFNNLNHLVGTIAARLMNADLIKDVRDRFIDGNHQGFFVPPGAFVEVIKGLERSRQLLAWRNQIVEEHIAIFGLA